MHIQFIIALFLIQVTFTVATNTIPCGRKPADIVFVLDESGSIWGPDFTKQLQFVGNLVEGFDIGPSGTRVGVETFGTQVRTIVQLGEIMDAKQLKRVIEGIRQHRGETGTHLALARLREMFAGSSSRSGASRVAIVITDGESDIPNLTAKEADQVHEAGIVVFAIGVGRSVKREELERIASNKDYVFTVDNYDDLTSLFTILAIKACPDDTTPITEEPFVKTTTWPEPAPATRPDEWIAAQSPSSSLPTPAGQILTTKKFPINPLPKEAEGCDRSLVFNVYFGLPDHLSTLDTYLALQFIRDLTTVLNETPASINLHLVPRTCYTTIPPPSAECSDSSNQIKFIAALDGRQADAVTRNDLQLQYIRKQEESYRRRYPLEDPDMRSAIAVLLIDNRLANMDSLMREVDYTKREGIQTVTIGIGDYADRYDLWKVASSERDLLYLHSYNHLATIKNALLQRVCIRGLVHSAGK